MCHCCGNNFYPYARDHRKQVWRQIQADSGWTIFIKPGYDWKVVDALSTSFHLPKSTIMLVSAFAGRELVLQAYQHAIEQKYRFFSLGCHVYLLKSKSELEIKGLISNRMSSFWYQIAVELKANKWYTEDYDTAVKYMQIWTSLLLWSESISKEIYTKQNIALYKSIWGPSLVGCYYISCLWWKDWQEYLSLNPKRKQQLESNDSFSAKQKQPKEGDRRLKQKVQRKLQPLSRTKGKDKQKSQEFMLNL